METPAIKGSAFQSVVDDLRRLADQGRLDLAELGLSDKDRAMLDEVITPVSWMPIATYDKLLRCLCDAEGGSDVVGYFRGRGARAAERLLNGSYHGFRPESGSWGPRVAEAFLGVSRMLYNFSTFRLVSAEGDMIEIRVEDAAAMPDTALEAACGFLGYFASVASGRDARVRNERIGADSIRIEVRTD